MDDYILSVDQSTAATKIYLFDREGRIVRRVAHEHRQYYPRPGWAEHDAREIWNNARRGIDEITEGLAISQVLAISIANQRETTVLWSRKSGEPLCPAIVWQDVRAEGLTRELAGYAEQVRDTTGLPLSAYYSAAKAAFALQDLGAKDDVCIGTIDSWLMWKMSGGTVFATDYSNAARTQLFDPRALAFSQDMLDIFGVRRDMLPTPLPCDSEFLRYKGIPVIGVLGDSHAALFGHGCQRAGQAKATYGTGSSVMMNTGREFMKKKGLSACVGFAYGGEVDYALEGNVTSSGDTLHWLIDLGLFESVEEIARLASTVPDAHGTNLVPAFSGLGAPYFDENARGLLNGLTRGSGKAQIAFAALQSIAQQNTDIIEEMAGLHTLYADGGGSGNSWLMQMQSDLARIKVVRQEQKEMSAWGAARMAGLKLDLYDGSTGFCNQTVFMPRADDEQVALWRQGWRSAIKQSRERR